MGSTSDRFSADPRYDTIYQRGGSTGSRGASQKEGAADRDHRATPAPSSAPRPADRVPAPDRTPSSGPFEQSAAEAYPAPPHGRAEDPSIIRELGADAPWRGDAAKRNPFDLWIWGVSAGLLALGVFLAFTPALFAEDIQQQAQSGYYTAHWSSYVSFNSVPLILLGIATAVTQLFVLSNRHARTR